MKSKNGVDLGEKFVDLVAYEIGVAVMEAISQGENISADSISAVLEVKQKMAGSEVYKSLYAGAIDLVKGYKKIPD
ncbi:hypothetical protein [Leminorella grimontii]|uniref:hypothetical protein n=1 Tax=Leminorella grimontii TaxID=82981 RepID=UPI00208DA090|nr:hypothetical protein [Leminorella grimontii]GKX58375.1 hypothetical protein SOASR031_06900 [Leminorella grimontii]